MKTLLLTLLVATTMQTAMAQEECTVSDFKNVVSRSGAPLSQTFKPNEQSTIVDTNKTLEGTYLGKYTDTYIGIKKFWGDDIIGKFFEGIGNWCSGAVTSIISSLNTNLTRQGAAPSGQGAACRVSDTKVSATTQHVGFQSTASTKHINWL